MDTESEHGTVVSSEMSEAGKLRKKAELFRADGYALGIAFMEAIYTMRGHE